MTSKTNDVASVTQAAGIGGLTLFGVPLPDVLLMISLCYTTVMLILKLPELWKLVSKLWTKESDDGDRGPNT